MDSAVNVVIIDDDHTTVFLYKQALLNYGFQTYGTTDVDDFFNHLRKSLPDVVLVDMHIPEMPGWQICRKIRSQPAMENVKIIGISGVFTENEDISRFSEHVDLYLIKPVDLESLSYTIRQVARQ